MEQFVTCKLGKELVDQVSGISKMFLTSFNEIFQPEFYLQMLERVEQFLGMGGNGFIVWEGEGGCLAIKRFQGLETMKSDVVGQEVEKGTRSLESFLCKRKLSLVGKIIPQEFQVQCQLRQRVGDLSLQEVRRANNCEEVLTRLR